MTASRSARERVRAEITREITDIARRQLATEGAGGLSLRAVAREMGMVSSAIYRYFPSRDDLLTTLIIDAYNAIGEAVEQAEAACPRDEFRARWMATCHALRDWAVAHPHEYALIYGSPVPGYHAPQDTVAARVRDVAVLGRIIADAWSAGALRSPSVEPPAELEADATALRGLMPGVPDSVILQAMPAWTALYGWLNFEIFGQFTGTLVHHRTAFDHAMGRTADALGLTQ